MGLPWSTAVCPRTMPSVGCMATQRTRFSPRCWAISAVTLMGTFESVPSELMWTAL